MDNLNIRYPQRAVIEANISYERITYLLFDHDLLQPNTTYLTLTADKISPMKLGHTIMIQMKTLRSMLLKLNPYKIINSDRLS